jgi:hypothetical protein
MYCLIILINSQREYFIIEININSIKTITDLVDKYVKNSNWFNVIFLKNIWQNQNNVYFCE